MTAPRELDRDFRAYFDGQAVGRAPDGLLDTALAGVASTRQRPRLLVTDWWLPQRIVSRPSPGPMVVAIVTLVLLVIALATVLLMIGSSRRPAPPFGLAKPGLIAFDADGDLFASKPDGSGLVQLTSGPEFDVLATYSPDGTLIAFESQQPDFSFDVFVMPADGGERIRVIEGLAGTNPIAWSPDSRHVAVAARPVGEDDENRQQILIGAIDDPGAVRVGGPDVFGSDPAWSPDGRRIAFHRSACCGETLDALWVSDVDGSDAREVAPNISDPRFTDMKSPSRTNRARGGAEPAWSPDGRRLAFLGLGVGNRRDVYIVDDDGTDLHNVSNSPEEEIVVAWSPDGTRLAYVGTDVSDGDASFIVTDADALNARPVPDPGLSPDLLIWSPDGARLLGMAFADPGKGLNANQNTIIELDPAGHVAPVTTRISHFGTASYQRLAP
jgi:dipeptidyl aminopeptidase/acylaminoacyl peptidase